MITASHDSCHPDHTGGEGAWKPTKTSWVHCRLWLKVPATYLPITDWVHSKCSQIMCSTWNLWEHLCNIWKFPNDILKMFSPYGWWEHFDHIGLFWEHHDHIQKTEQHLKQISNVPIGHVVETFSECHWGNFKWLLTVIGDQMWCTCWCYIPNVA